MRVVYLPDSFRDAHVQRRRLRIAQLCHEYPPHLGGLEIVVRELSERFAQDVDVVVVTAAYGNATGIERRGSLTEYRLPSVRPIERFGVPYTVPSGALLSEARAALASSDLIHVHGSLYAQSLLGASAARRSRIPLVVTEHVGWVHYDSALLRAVQHVAWATVGRRVLADATAVVTFNERVTAWMSRQRPTVPVEIIRNGVDLSTYAPVDDSERSRLREKWGLPQDQVLALAVGRDVPKKQLGALRAFARQSHLLVTCGNTLPSIPGAQSLGLIPSSSMPEVYRACDFLVHAGVGEGFPLAIQEAMACGRAVVLLWDDAYAMSVMKSAVVAATGLEEVRTACEALATDEALRKAIGARSRTYAELHWSWDAAVAQYRDLYQRALEGTLSVPHSSSPRSIPSERTSVSL